MCAIGGSSFAAEVCSAFAAEAAWWWRRSLWWVASLSLERAKIVLMKEISILIVVF